MREIEAKLETKGDPESPSSSPEPEEEEHSEKPKKRRGKQKPRTRNVKPTDSSGMHRRSREGCYTCRVRRKKCDELTPTCTACLNLRLNCEYEMPTWWKDAELRKRHKDYIKREIRSTKPPPHSKNKTVPLPPPPVMETPPIAPHSLPTPDTLSAPLYPVDRSSFDTFSPPFQMDTPHSMFDSTPIMPAPQWTPLPPQYPAFPTPQWELDIRTERQIYVNGYPSTKESTTSTFGTWDPATPTMMLPSYPPQAWTKQDSFEIKHESFGEEPFDPNYFEFSNEPIKPAHQVVIDVEDCDRPLLNHFLQNVAPFIFSVFDAKQKGSSLGDVVLPQLENNPIYLSCCLSSSALHLKITEHIEGEEIDSDIIKHRAAAISALFHAFSDDSIEPSRLLEATLALVLFQSSVGSSDDGLPDIAWHHHFQAVASLIENIQSQQSPLVDASITGHHAAFNMTLAYWIDILGATALRRMPLFADTYRSKIEVEQPSGLAELMGCDDRVMYLISEIACLEHVKLNAPDLDDKTLCEHVASLGHRLGMTEFGEGEVGPIYTPGTGAIRPRQLSRNITAIFRFAARIYLCSLVPDEDLCTESISPLLNRISDAMAFIPTGPDGFDRALVWPLLVAGSYAGQYDAFRIMFRYRALQLGQVAEFGSFGRVKEILEEVWSANDDAIKEGRKATTTWRDVMEKKQLDYLIL